MVSWKAATSKLSKQDQAEFLEKIVTSLHEGYSVTDAMLVLLPFYLDELEQQKIISLFREGHNLAEVFLQLGYSQALVESIRLAEFHGRIAFVLQQSAEHLRKQQLLKKQAIATLSYPIGLILFMSVLFSAFKLYFLPLFLPLIERSNPDALSRIEFIFSMPFYGVVVLVTTGGVLLGYSVVASRMKEDTFLKRLRRVKFLRSIQNAYGSWILSKELSLLIESGMTIRDSLQFLQVSKSRVLSQAASQLLDSLGRGESLSQAVRLCSWVSQDLIKYLEHGEVHGYLAKELQLYQQFKLEYVQKRIQLIIAIAQPILFLLIGAMVVSAYLSLMLPIYNLIQV